MRNFWCMFVVVSLSAESFGREETEDMIGILGESITFHLKTSRQFTIMPWLKENNQKADQLALVNTGPPCQVTAFSDGFDGRLNAPEDCKSLQITDLHLEDSATYTAAIPKVGNAEKETFKFKLQVYKRLLEADLKVQCENNTLGRNITLQLNCSVGKWEHDVKYIWTSSSKSGTVSQAESLIIQDSFQDDNLNYTCTAGNPVGNASKTVTLKETCKAANPTTVASTETVASMETENQKTSISDGKLLPVWIILSVTVITAACVIGFLMWKKKKRAASRVPSCPTDCSVPDESSRTIYAQIESLPTQQTGMKRPQPQKRQKPKDGLHTVYASVVQPKPTPLQTDDEKIQLEGQRTSEKSKKNIHSADSKPQETDDPSIKTVYDTINAPRCPEGSDFHKLL